MATIFRFLSCALFVFFLPFSDAAGETNLADGFTKLPHGSQVVVMPLDIELFELGAGGIQEPQAEWTAQAHENVVRAFRERPFPNTVFVTVDAASASDFEALNRLHGAVGTAIVLHHSIPVFALPTKHGKLDWSLGESFSNLKETTGARYALFSFVRDSYASGGRVAAIVVGAILGVGISGGVQTGYASLVDLDTGQIVWFNRLSRGYGDLRNFDSAKESLNALLKGFPD
jgi:hypothetical protein